MYKVMLLAIVTCAACGGGWVTGGNEGKPDAAIAAADAALVDAPLADAAIFPPQTSRLRISNRCSETLWIAHNGTAEQNVALAPGEYHDYAIPAEGLPSVRYWPKLGCDASGHACRIGDTGEGGGAPCSGGCQPPVDSKFEITFASTGGTAPTFYNLSLVDGFTLPFKVIPVGAGAENGSCVTSDCAQLQLSACPAHEDLSGSGAFPAFTDVDLRLRDPGDAARTLACLSPCKKWNYSAPYGLGHPEGEDPGLHMCCPTPFTGGSCTAANGCISADDCRDTSDPLSVTRTDYVHAIHALCPSAYSYSYDDVQGLHACPATTQFEVVFCP
jgi:Thaumatin family